jgi:glycosyltransferase involved in cell wall biosynthesis
MDLISIVVPCYNEEEVLPAFYTEITKVMGNLATEKNINYEVIFVDDGSKDKTLPILEQYAQADTHV